MKRLSALITSLAVASASFAASADYPKSVIIFVQNGDVSSPLGSIDVTANPSQSGTLTSKALSGSQNVTVNGGAWKGDTFTALGRHEWDPSGCAPTQEDWQALGVTQLSVWGVSMGQLHGVSLDPDNPYRTRVDIPFRIQYDALANAALTGVDFYVISSNPAAGGPALAKGTYASGTFIMTHVNPGATTSFATEGTDVGSYPIGGWADPVSQLPKKAGPWNQMFFPIISAGTAFEDCGRFDQQLALAVIPKSDPTATTIVALGSPVMQVYPKHRFTIGVGASGTITDVKNLPTISVLATNLYPGAKSWVELRPTLGKKWMSPLVVTNPSNPTATFSIPLAQALEDMAKVNNVIDIYTVTETTIAGHEEAKLGAPIVVDTTGGTIDIKLSTL